MVFILNMIHAIIDTGKDHGIYTRHDTCNYKCRYKVIFILYLIVVILDTGREYHMYARVDTRILDINKNNLF